MDMVMDSVFTSTVRIPTEVEGIILSFLGKSDLLNCRLVCQDWDTECRKILKKSNFTMKVNRSNIVETLNFTTQQGRMILPIHLDIEIEESERDCGVFKKLNKEVGGLLNLAGQEGIRSLSLTYLARALPGLRGLNNLLCKISRGLKMLNVTKFGIDIKNKEGAIEILKRGNLRFPNIRRIYLDQTDRVSRQAISSMLIDICPKFEELNYSYDKYNQMSCPFQPVLNFAKLKVLQLNYVDPVDFLKNVQTSGSVPVLQTLEIGSDNSSARGNNTKDEIFEVLLNSFSTTLESLSLTLNPGLVSDIWIISFPKLPQLKQLKLKIRYDHDRPFYLYQEEFRNFNSENLPALKSMDIPTRLMLHTAMPDSCDRLLGVPALRFPNVIHLTLRVDYTFNQEFDYQEIIHTNVRNYNKIFPNVSRVSIVNECLIGRNQNVICTIRELIHALNATKIEVFEIKNYDRDYLGQVLELLDRPPRIILENFKMTWKLETAVKKLFARYAGSTSELKQMDLVEYNDDDKKNVEKYSTTFQEKRKATNHKMTNVKIIRLVECANKYLQEKTYERRFRVNIEQKLPFIRTIIKHFPKLALLEMSPALFNNDRDDGVQTIDDLRAKYDHLTINKI